LDAQGVGGWLAVMEGNYYGRRSRVDLPMVRRLAGQAGDWDAAVAAFEKVRKAYLAA